MIKVLVVDDSALVRATMTEVLKNNPDIKVIDTAPDPIIAVRKIQRERPDVITLDIEMDRMDGLTFLRKLNETVDPIPVVICSALVHKGSKEAMLAYEYGAAEVILKPAVGTKRFIEESKVIISDAIKSAFQCTGKIKQLMPSQVELHSQDYRDSMSENSEEKNSAEPVSKRTVFTKPVSTERPAIQPKLTADAVIEKPNPSLVIEKTPPVVVVGASTGGTEALKDFLTSLPEQCPGIVIVQHMPEHFTAAFAQRLDGLCKVHVKEAENGDKVENGKVLIAPGNYHTLLKRVGKQYSVEVKDGPLVSRHRPSVDVLFRSAARYAGKNAIGIIMTGMGDDGAKGMKEMHDAGAFNIAQDESSCIVYGMPGEAVKAGAVDKIVPLTSIAYVMLTEAAKR